MMITVTEDEFLPPTEFVVSIILPLSTSHAVSTIKSANWICPTCWRSSYSFNCSKCVLDIGQLTEKKQRLEELMSTRRRLIEKIESCLNRFTEQCDLETERLNVERQLADLRSSCVLRRENMQIKAGRMNESKKLTNEKRQILTDLRQMSYTLDKWSTNLSKSLIKRSTDLEKRRKHLCLVRQQTGLDLFKNIFLLDTITVTSNDSCKNSITTTISSDVSSSIEIVDALTEATLTNFCHDRWIFMGRQAEIQYRFVHSCTIGDFCDYAPLTGWLFSRQVDVPMTDSLFSNKSALGALSALAYLTQTTSVLSRIFDITLPFSITLVEFYDEKLNEDEFETLNLKLNFSVAYLCFSQGLREECVCLSRPFWNMLNFFNNLEKLGIDGERAFTLNATLERDFRRAAKQITWSESRVTSTARVEQTGEEWETVNEQLPEWTGPTTLGSSPPMFTQFFASATTSVANLFKTVHG